MPKDTPDSKRAARRRKLYGAALLAAIGLFQAHAESLLTSLAHGEVTAQAWAAAYVEALADLHGHAAFAGRGVASTLTGDPAPTLGLADDLYGAAVAADQAAYVAGFREDIEEGKYGDLEAGEFDPERCASRVGLYANRAHGAAHEAMVGALGDEDGIEWVDSETEDHCKTCPKWAEEGPYTRHTLPAVPGDGKSDCGTNCLCYLRVNGIDVPMLARPDAYAA